MSLVQKASQEIMSELRIEQPSCEQIAGRCGFSIPYTIHLLRALGAGAKQPRTGLAAASEEQQGPLSSQPVSTWAKRALGAAMPQLAARLAGRPLSPWLTRLLSPTPPSDLALRPCLLPPANPTG